MTPEEIAQKIVNDPRWLDFDYVGDDDRRVPDVDRDALAADIAALVRAAICGAYERAALVCDARADERERQADNPKNTTGSVYYFRDMKIAYKMAAANIRALKGNDLI